MAYRIPFRNRAHEVSRVEAFSDVIFGFSISLLVVSLEAPKTYEQMMEVIHGFLPFAICFWLFIDIWFEHHKFFKRYALQDSTIMALNTFLLFVLLIYVYPLKYMFTLFAESLTGGHPSVPPGGIQFLFTLYGIGLVAVFWLLAAMNVHALRSADALGLNEVERIDTRESIYDNLWMGVFGLISVALVHSRLAALAGVVYFLICIPKTLVPWIMGIKRRKAEERILATPDAAEGLAHI